MSTPRRRQLQQLGGCTAVGRRAATAPGAAALMSPGLRWACCWSRAVQGHAGGDVLWASITAEHHALISTFVTEFGLGTT